MAVETRGNLAIAALLVAWAGVAWWCDRVIWGPPGLGRHLSPRWSCGSHSTLREPHPPLVVVGPGLHQQQLHRNNGDPGVLTHPLPPYL